MKATHSYVGFLQCGCPVAAVVDEGTKDTARSVKEFIEEGLTIRRETVEWARKNLRRCKHRAEQRSLPS